jgi:hypothetical protein
MASNLSTEEIISALEKMDAGELEQLAPRVIALAAARRAPHLKPEESQLLARVNESLPAELKSRLGCLEDKQEEGSITEAEWDELRSLSDRVERLHAHRLEALAELARLRGTTLPELMEKLGIRFPENA